MNLQSIKTYYIFKLLSSVLLQMTALILVYLLSPDEYGQLALIMTVAQLMYIFTSGWNNAAILNLGTKYYVKTGDFTNVVAYRSILLLISFVLVSLLFLFFRDRIILFIQSSTAYIYIYYFFLALVAYDFTYQLLYPCERNLLQSILDLCLSSFILSYAIFELSNLEEYISLTLKSNIVYFVIVIFFFFFHRKIVFHWENNVFKEILHYSLWQFLGVAGVYIVNISTNYILRIYDIPLTEIGLYNFSYRLFSGFTPLFALYGIVLPKILYRLSKKDDLKSILTKIKYGIIIFCIMYLILCSILSPLLSCLSKNDYMPATTYLFCLFPAFVFMTYNQLINPIILNTPYYKHSQYATLIQGISLVSFNLIFIYIWGIYGALLGTVIAFMTKSYYMYLILSRKILRK